MDDADIWHRAHEIAAAEIKRIRSGSWGGGHEPNPGLAAAIANHAIAVRDAEREACARIAEIWGERKDRMTDTAFVPGATQSERFASEGIAAFIRARSL